MYGSGIYHNLQIKKDVYVCLLCPKSDQSIVLQFKNCYKWFREGLKPLSDGFYATIADLVITDTFSFGV